MLRSYFLRKLNFSHFYLKNKMSKRNLLLGISAKIQHGKSYTATSLQKMATEEYGIPFTVLSWAECLRDIVQIITGVDKESTRTQEQKSSVLPYPNLIYDSHTIYRNLLQYFQNITSSFPDDFTFPSLGENVDADHIFKASEYAFNYISSKRSTITVGEILQFVGTEVFRNKINKDFWINCLMEKWKTDGYPPMIIDDCRFPNEVERVQQEGGFVVRIKRVDIQNISTSRDPNHPSEISLDNYPLFTLINTFDSRFDVNLRLFLFRIIQKYYRS